MSTRGMYLIGMLALLFLANLAMLMGMTNWPQRTREGFVNCMGKKEKFANKKKEMFADMEEKKEKFANMKRREMFADMEEEKKEEEKEGFMDYLTNGFLTAPIGSWDGMNMLAGLPKDAQGFKAGTPNEPHKWGGKWGRRASPMLPFEENQCKPECCPATMACDGGGCVCTTPEDRDLINTRGGNRKHDDSDVY